MTPEQIETLYPAFAGFHQDFNLVGQSEWEVLEWHARGLHPSMREPLYSALEALLCESHTEEQFNSACWTAGADLAPTRAELENFVSWVRTPKGIAEIEGPGPTSTHLVAHINLNLD